MAATTKQEFTLATQSARYFALAETPKAGRLIEAS